MNILDYLIILALAMWLFLAARSLASRKKSSCCGGCSGCGNHCNQGKTDSKRSKKDGPLDSE